MKRIVIKDKNGVQTHSTEMPDPTDWIERNREVNSWGLLERLKFEDDCTPEEIASALEVQDIEVSPAIPGDPDAEPPTEDTPAVIKKRYRLPQTYQVVITDMQAEIDAENTKKAALLTLKNRIEALDGQADLTATELKESARKLVKFLRLKGLLDT